MGVTRRRHGDDGPGWAKNSKTAILRRKCACRMVVIAVFLKGWCSTKRTGLGQTRKRALVKEEAQAGRCGDRQWVGRLGLRLCECTTGTGLCCNQT
jgi:hypothetical protein